jgi:hypothetical protein
MSTKRLFSFFVRRESKDDHLAKDSENYADDLDMIISPRDGSLVVVGLVNGVHVCQMCFEQFVDDPAHKHRGVEFNPGGYGTRLLLHSCCVEKASRYKGNLLQDKVEGHQARRFATKASVKTGSDDA